MNGRPYPHTPNLIQPTVSIAGLGTDLVDIPSFQALLDRYGEAFIERTFTPAEIASANAGHRRILNLAVSFAVKEGVLKALGTGFTDGTAFTDIEVIPRGALGPNVHLTGRCAELATVCGVDRWLVTISTTESIVGAVVMALSAE
jgi:holo-[acyl-carrier protein] synthase